MASDYPYMISNNKIQPIMESIEHAEKPTKFTHEFLKKLGYTSSNDRAIIPLMKRLGFLTENGVPTDYYNDLKDKNRRPYVLGDRIKELYDELYQINTKIHDQSEDEIKGAISRVTGKDSKSVSRYYSTFKTLAGLAKFDSKPKAKPQPQQSANPQSPNAPEKGTPQKQVPPIGLLDKNPKFFYNIQIHLPATNDISVYNAIFKSLKDNLDI